MSLNVNQKENNFFLHRKAAGLACGFFFALLGLGCQLAPLQNASLSSIDGRYRLQRAEVKNQSTDGSILFYRGIVSKTLASHCKWYPNDSAYTDLAQKRCGLAQGTLSGVSRFMIEEDAGRMGYPTVRSGNSLHFVDIPNECSL